MNIKLIASIVLTVAFLIGIFINIMRDNVKVRVLKNEVSTLESTINIQKAAVEAYNQYKSITLKLDKNK